jgi:Flp pilus assembly protein TadG
MTSPPQSRSPSRRRGVSTIESILVLVILIIASMAAVQFGLALIVRQAITHAATVAAREAAKGADADELVEVVETVLAGHQITIGDEATLVLENGPEEVDVEIRGTLACDPPAAPVIGDDENRVTLCVSLTAPPFLNILKCYGIDFRGRTFQSSSVATDE